MQGQQPSQAVAEWLHPLQRTFQHLRHTSQTTKLRQFMFIAGMRPVCAARYLSVPRCL